MVNINTILDWFRTGKKPTQAQFWESWKSFWHKEETIPQTSVEDLPSSLNLKADKDGTLSFKGDIPNAANLNDYIGSGIYLQGANVHAAAGINYPIAEAGQLEVVANPDFVYQKYHAYGPNNEIFYRTYYSPTGWFPWKKVVSERELINLSPEIVDNFNSPTGFKTLEASPEAANRPGVGVWGAGIQFSTNSNTGYINQLVYDVLGYLYTRSKYDGSWVAWQKILTSESSIEINRAGSLNNTGEDNKDNNVWFDYTPMDLGAGYAGSVISWSGLNGNYPVQITADYGTGNNIFFRTKNGDTNVWNTTHRIWHSGHFDMQAINNWNTITSKANDSDVLHRTGDETKTGNITIDGNNKGYYLGNLGHNASIVYNSNGNLDITPRAGYHTIFASGNVGIGTSNPLQEFVVANPNNGDGFEVAVGDVTGKVYLHSYNRSVNAYIQLQLDASKTILGAAGNVLIGSDNDTGEKLQVDGNTIIRHKNTSDFKGLVIANTAYDQTSPSGVENRISFQWADSDAGYIGSYKETFNTSGLKFATQYGFGNIVEKMRITPYGQLLLGTDVDNSSGSILQINGRASGEPAVSSNEFVTKSQIENLPTITATEVELNIPYIGGYDHYEDYPYFEGATVGDFVEIVIPLSFNIPFLDIKCLCVGDNKIMVRFTTLSQNYCQGGTDIFKFRIIK